MGPARHLVTYGHDAEGRLGEGGEHWQLLVLRKTEEGVAELAEALSLFARSLGWAYSPTLDALQPRRRSCGVGAGMDSPKAPSEDLLAILSKVLGIPRRALRHLSEDVQAVERPHRGLQNMRG